MKGSLIDHCIVSRLYFEARWAELTKESYARCSNVRIAWWGSFPPESFGTGPTQSKTLVQSSMVGYTEIVGLLT